MGNHNTVLKAIFSYVLIQLLKNFYCKNQYQKVIIMFSVYKPTDYQKHPWKEKIRYNPTAKH